MINRLFAPIGLTLLATSAMAHPGAHDDIAAAQLADHVTSSVFHIGTFAALAAVAIIALVLLHRRQTAPERDRKDR